MTANPAPSLPPAPDEPAPEAGDPAATGAESTRWHYRRSLASRVALLTTIVVGLAIAGVAAAAFFTVKIQLQNTLDQTMLDRAQQAADADLVPQLINSQIPSSWLGAADVRIAYIPADGIPRSLDEGPQLVVGKPEFDVQQGNSERSVRTISAGGIRYRVVTVPAGDSEALILAQSLAPTERVLRNMGVAMLFFGGAGVLAAALAGWGVARNGLRPVRRLTASVENVARTEDLRPLQVEGHDEIARLAGAFNTMLTALAASRDRQRQLVADAGHELRTPLTSLRTNLDLLVQADAQPSAIAIPPQARAELLDDVRAQIAEMTTLIGDLVELARDEPMAAVVEEVDLSEVLDQALSRVRRRAPALEFTVSAAPWWLVGEGASLERALTNLLDNAAKWSPADGTVRVTLVDGVLTVDDEGPGIAVEDRPHVFDRFYRSKESRAMPGSGLGLSIVRQVAERHSGLVHAAAAPGGGARMVFSVPGSPSPPSAAVVGSSALP